MPFLIENILQYLLRIESGRAGSIHSSNLRQLREDNFYFTLHVNLINITLHDIILLSPIKPYILLINILLIIN